MEDKNDYSHSTAPSNCLASCCETEMVVDVADAVVVVVVTDDLLFDLEVIIQFLG
jgi:hypothetical protein